MVGPAEEVDRAVRQAADEVPSAVEASSRLGRRTGKGIGDEALGREIRAAQVAESQAVSAEEKLPVRAGSDGLEPAVQHVSRGVGDGPADRHGDRPFRHRRDAVTEGESRALGRPVAVEQPLGGALGQHLPHPTRIERLAAREHVPHAAEGIRNLARHLVEKGRGEK